MSQYEQVSLILQAIVAVGAFATLGIYYHQLKVMSGQLTTMQEASRAQGALSLVSFLQSEDVRAARKCVREVLSAKEFTEWTDAERTCAALVTSNYDVVAALLKAGLAPSEVITRNWGPSIRHCYEVLTPFVKEHRAQKLAPIRRTGATLIGCTPRSGMYDGRNQSFLRTRSGIAPQSLRGGHTSLTVTESNAPAIALHQRCGFRSSGTEPMAIATPTGYKAKVHMWLPIGDRCLAGAA
jgi:hypothetical protein